MEKEGIFYEGFTFVFAADRTVRHHAAFADVVISLFVAVLFDVAACLYRDFWQYGIINIGG